MAAKLKENPAFGPYFERAGFHIDPVTKKLDDFSAAQERAYLGPYKPGDLNDQKRQSQLLDQIGITDLNQQNLIIQHSDELDASFHDAKKRFSGAGVDYDDITKKSDEFERHYQSIMLSLGTATDGWTLRLENALNGPLKDLDDWMKANPGWTSAGVAGAAVVGTGGVGLLLKNMAGGFGLGGAATGPTGAATALTEAAIKLQGAALTGSAGGKIGAAEKAAAGVAGAEAVAHSGGGSVLDSVFKLFRNAGATGATWLGGLSAGSLLYGEESGNQGIRALMKREHPDWSDDQMREWLKSVKAGINPDDASPAKPLHDRPPVVSPAPEDRRSWWQKEKDLWSPWGPAKAADVDVDQDQVNRSLKSYDDGELGLELDRESRRGRVLGGLQEAQEPRPASPAVQAPPKQEDTLRDQRFEALRAMLDIGTSDGGAAIKVDGVPVSSGHPLPVTFGQQDQLSAEGTEAFGGGGNGGAGGGHQSAVPDTRNFWQRHAPAWLGGQPDPNAGVTGIRARAIGGTPVGKEADLAKQGYDYWIGQGLTHDQALWVLGDQRGENQLGSLARGPSGEYGQFQWDEARRQNILKATGIDVATAGFIDQQKAARWEFEHSERPQNRIWDRLRAAKTEKEGVWELVHNFEQSAAQQSDLAMRMGYAERYRRLLEGASGSPASAAPRSNIHIPNVYTGGQSSQYPSPTEQSAPLAKEGEQPHDYLLTKPRPHDEHVASAFRPEDYPAIFGGDWGSWFENTFSVPHAEAATAPAASHTFTQNVNMKVDGAADPSIVAHQVASRVKRSATDLTTQFKGAVQ